jgi:threonine dehydrogenase-like Zn-dependent dehydrogenase
MRIPSTQNAVELVGADRVELNSRKKVFSPGPYQILARVEAVGLCFSDLKLLKQFDKHVRKGPVVSGIDKNILKEVPGYRPGPASTVPGHETLCTIAATGKKVSHHQAGEHVLVQADYPWLKTAKSNAAFGYNFEGALQQYVLMDERIILDPQSGESTLIPVESELSASSLALIEPWACVESSYNCQERNTVLPGGKLLIAAEAGRDIEGIKECFSPEGRPAKISVYCDDVQKYETAFSSGIDAVRVNNLESLPEEEFNDVIYFGSNPAVIELLNNKLTTGGIINIVLGGRKIGREVSVGLGRVHYSRTRWIGTVGTEAWQSYKCIPGTGEVRKSDKVLIIGAAGPMGQMHTIRMLRCGRGSSITASDIDDARLETLKRKVVAIARTTDVDLSFVNPEKESLQEKFSYFAVMAPVGSLIARAVKDSMEGALVNLFAGIPVSVRQKLDLDRYIANKCFMFGVSGSRLSDMKIVLKRVLNGQLDTDCCVDAVSGMAGAVEGIRAVENRTMAGKIVVYPQMVNLPLIKLDELKEKYPRVAGKLKNGMWTRQAEQELLSSACYD